MAQPKAPGPGAEGGMNAKERRAARRKAEQQQQQQQQQVSAGGSISPKAEVIESIGGSTPTTAGTSAKERRALRRAAERAAASPAGGAVPNPTVVKSETAAPAPASVATSPAPTTAKERRAAKRAAARASAVPTDSGVVRLTADGAKPAAAQGGMNAKERRLLRREEERKKREREGEDGGDGGSARDKRRVKGAAGGNGGGGRPNPFIVFVGQLAYSTTAEGVEEHFRTRGGIEGKISVRLLTRKGTNPPRSKGMAFVEVEDAESAYQCLSLHHTRLDGRLLNVERTSGGGKEKKGERIQEKRGEQKEFMKSVVQRVLGEFITAGRLGKTELDEAAQGVLEKMEAKVMERAVKDYCDKPDRLELHNPSAWFTHHAHELCFRADPEDLEAGSRDWLNDEKIKASGRSRDRDRAAKKARGEQVNVGRGGGRGAVGAGPGGRGGGGSGRVSRGGGSRIMGQERGGFGAGGRTGPGRVPVQTASAPGASDGAETGAGAGLAEKEAPVAPAAGLGRGGGPAGGDGGDGGERAEGERKRQRDTSDLMSIFPSLRGRGGGRAGGMGGRGGGDGARDTKWL
eukprot:g10963.t1